jgi:peptidoglycan/xylan/chitin deacetylase (PgdA/CDA1 family)
MISVFLCDGVGVSEDVEGVIAEVAQAVWSHWAVAGDAPREVSLSIDDVPQIDEGPRLSAEQRNGLLIQALADRRLQAAVYVVARGAQNAGGEKMLEQWSAAGHRIGNHTFKHSSIDKVALADFEKDFIEGRNAIAGLAGYFRFFRFPYLKEGKTAETRDAFKQFLALQHYRAAEVSIDASDWYYNERLTNLLREDAGADTSAYREAYVAHLLDRAQYYDNLARRVAGRSPAHVLLTHASLLNALFLPDVLAAFVAHGWTWIEPERAYADPFYATAPQTLPAGESLVWSLAKEKSEAGLRYPGEDAMYEKAKLDALGL